tara:strand:+ start:6966 stop:8006 length:1041 start_codon:yes stop_codon:yes gene_type:complete
MLQFLPYALAAYGGYQGYRSAKEAGASPLGRLFGAGIGAYGGYNLGAMVPGVSAAGFGNTASASFVPRFTQTQTGSQLASSIGMSSLGVPSRAPQGMVAPGSPKFLAAQRSGGGSGASEGGSLIDVLFRKRAEGGGFTDEIDPLKLALTTGGGMLALGAFDKGPTDIYMPGYNMSYLELAKQRGNYKYIDPDTGQEKEYETIYKPEQQGIGKPRVGAYSLDVTRLRTGGIAEIKKFNEGGVNYLPSKVSHDENDATNYVRASGYVEDGAGVGDKDEDTMLAQLADGEFVTRADGVLGAGIIAGANPNSIKDMREKGAQYFYQQQARYKRVFDLLKEKNGDSKQKTN